jgi:hypothetical protein
MRRVLIIAILLWSGLQAHAETLDRAKWVQLTATASKSCLAIFRHKFGNAQDHNYASCLAEQSNKEIDACIGKGEFSNCVLQRSLKVYEVCDLSKC